MKVFRGNSATFLIAEELGAEFLKMVGASAESRAEKADLVKLEVFGVQQMFF